MKKFYKKIETPCVGISIFSYLSGIGFDNQGKYLIINGAEGCEVIDAVTGELLFSLDRTILIHNNVIYDVSDDLVLPDILPRAEFGSIREYIKKGREFN